MSGSLISRPDGVAALRAGGPIARLTLCSPSSAQAFTLQKSKCYSFLYFDLSKRIDDTFAGPINAAERAEARPTWLGSFRRPKSDLTTNGKAESLIELRNTWATFIGLHPSCEVQYKVAHLTVGYDPRVTSRQASRYALAV